MTAERNAPEADYNLAGWRGQRRTAPRLIHRERDCNETLYHLSLEVSAIGFGGMGLNFALGLEVGQVDV